MKKIFCLCILILSINGFANINGFSAKPKFETDTYIKSLEGTTTSSDSYLFEITKELLNKTLVWGTWIQNSDSSIYPVEFTTGFSTLARLIYFELSPDKKWMLMFEADSQNPLFTPSVVDRFPVVELKDNVVTFDYSQGLPQRKLRSWTNDADGTTIKIIFSYVNNFKNELNEITFAEVLKLDDKNQSTMVLRHGFRLHEENSDFPKVLVKRPWKLGYLPAAFQDTDKPVPTRKFDISKPVKFYLSSNIPKEYLPAVKEGILWWNEAFGREVIVLEELKEPVDWASARINIFQWSNDPSFCTAGFAYGPSLANPVTGEIYHAKVIFCGTSFQILHPMSFKPNTTEREEFLTSMYKWAAAHEFGHAIGLAHNFYGKLYRTFDPEVITSTVMDYPFPQDIMKITTLGARDYSQIDFLYLRSGSNQVLNQLKKYPICDDGMTMTDVACNRFTRGGMTPEELISWFLEEITKEENDLVPADSKMTAIFHKHLLLKEKSDFISDYQKAIEYFSKDNKYDKFLSELIGYATANKETFNKLSDSYKDQVYYALTNYITSWDKPISMETRKLLVDTIKVFGDVKAFNKLTSLKTTLDGTYREEAYRLNSYLNEVIKTFWN